MTPPLTLRPNCLQESFATNESTSTQIFGVMYIILTGMIDSMLAPILWWALPAGPAGCLPAISQEPPTGWIPDTKANLINSDKNTLKQQKGAKCPFKAHRPPRKSHPPPRRMLLSLVSERIQDHFTGGEKSDGSLTNHSFYNSLSDEEFIKKNCPTQMSPKDKSPRHKEHHNKPLIIPLCKALLASAPLWLITSCTLITYLASAMIFLAPGAF
ncbi:hypothetical protein DSO57_1004079 [Entomophthora muscae]|uniref:Uncharacterized protein n=1 Tax=Entomophthora muscae TaxID=34485 RepID=A0ACC2SXE5_9FUNG|nr:hypothetical protein DSO57_1004079 [Entomophthora muscae]